MTRSRAALLIALGLDNFGTGLFLPLVLLYVTREVGLPLGVAGMAITGGGLVAFAVPPVAGHLVDWIGPRWVVVAAFLVQATGVSLYLLAHGVVTVVVVAMIVAVGQQLFYCALYVLVADVAGNVPKDRPFAVVAMVRTACFGAGAFAAAFVPSGYRMALVGDVLTFLLAAAVVVTFVDAPHKVAWFEKVPAKVTQNRPYLALIFFCGLFSLSLDFFLVGMPVFVLDQLRGPSWLPGAILAVFTLSFSLSGTLALRHTRRFTRIGAMRLGSALFAAWSALSLIAIVVPFDGLPLYLLTVTLVLAAGELIFGPRGGALAEAAAPPAARGRYLAAYQYAFTFSSVLAPAVAGLFSLAVWLPWVLVAACACLAVAGLGWLGPRLPEEAVTPIQG
ncbi:MFS transporter [Amycolatopsis sp. cg5]|uniref:MFS transporter n=1 Tax=Amycolatopsis sp. cg5 TaxID=3238802 RepID=UPI00352668D7